MNSTSKPVRERLDDSAVRGREHIHHILSRHSIQVNTENTPASRRL